MSYPAFKMPVTASRTRDGVWDLRFQCPACGREHHHGGGRDEQPSSYGTRVPHCAPVWDQWGRLVFPEGLTADFDFDLRPATEDVDWANETRRANRHVAEAVGELFRSEGEAASEKEIKRRAATERHLTQALEMALKSLPK